MLGSDGCACMGTGLLGVAAIVVSIRTGGVLVIVAPCAVPSLHPVLVLTPVPCHTVMRACALRCLC